MPDAAVILELEIRYGFADVCLRCAGRFLTSEETECEAKAKNDMHDQGPRTDSLMGRIRINLDHATLTCNLIRQVPHKVRMWESVAPSARAPTDIALEAFSN